MKVIVLKQNDSIVSSIVIQKRDYIVILLFSRVIIWYYNCSAELLYSTIIIHHGDYM